MAAKTASAGAPTGAYAVLLLTVFIDMVGFGIIIPLLPFWAQRFGATPDLVALLMSVYAAFQFVCAFGWGWLSDRWGRKPVLLISLFGSVVSFILLGLADSLLIVFVSRALGGAMGANIAVAQAYIADITSPENRAKGMGLLGAAFGSGFILGPAFGGLLAGSDPVNPDFRTPFFVAAAISATGLVLGFILLKEPARHARPHLPRSLVARFRAFAVVLGNPNVALPILIATVMGFAMSGLEATYALWTERAHGWGGRQNGFFFAYIGVVLVIVQAGLVGPLARRFGEPRILVAGVAALMLGFALVPASLIVPLVLLNGALVAIGIGLGNPMLNSLTSRNAPPDQQGAVLGASQSAQSLARIFGPSFAGVLFANFGRDAPYYAGTAILLVVLVISFRVVKREAAARRQSANES